MVQVFFIVFPHFYSVFWAFLKTQIVSHCAKIVFCKILGMSKMRFSKRKLHFCFCLFYVGKIETKERKTNKMEKAQKPCKNRFFWRWSSKNVKNPQKWIFGKNWVTLFVRKGEKTAHFRAHYLFWPKIFFGPKQCKPGKTIKIVVSAEIAQNQK